MAGTRAIPLERLRRLRAAAQLLHRPTAARDSVEIARAIGGAQAQDVHAGPLSFRSRSRRLTAADIHRARTEERSLLRTWAMRMTIHLIPADDAGWMLPLFEPVIERWSRRRLGQLGMPDRAQERALRTVAQALESDGPLSRSALADRVVAAGIELNSQTRLHLMGLAVTSGLACLGPDRGRSTCLVRREDWLGTAPRGDREVALAELARRYLRAFGPASDRDFAYWSGLGLREVRSGLGAIAGELDETPLGEGTLLTLRGALPRLPRSGWIRLLGAFDTYLLGHRSRALSVPDEQMAAVKAAGGGWIRPVIVRDGIVIGGWHSALKGNRIEITLSVEGATASERSEIEAEVEDIGRFEGVEAVLR